VGAGWNEVEYRAFGIPFDHRVSRFQEAFAIVRPLLEGERVTLDGTYWQAEDAVLLPPPRRRPKLMVGSKGPRMLGITLPYVDAWNAWWDDYGNSAEGFAALNERISAAAREAGRTPEEIERSACVLVVLDRAAGERPVTGEAPPVEGSADQIAAALTELDEAGADEAILVLSPITERSIRELAEALAVYRSGR
jgi:alkanesulfonate monooxygenase SsuD/methylene tetrahydromethanopterin reductase-like flavin-dependent oxidoreductase (luciferase family)